MSRAPTLKKGRAAGGSAGGRFEFEVASAAKSESSGLRSLQRRHFNA